MIRPQRLSIWSPSNTIMRTELAHQRRSAGRRRWLRLIWRFGTATIFALVLLFSSSMTLTILRGSPIVFNPFVRDTLGQFQLLAIIWTFLLHFGLMFETLSRAANGIVREKQGNTWELLVLTGTNAGQIVGGKWTATIRRMWRRYALLGVLRAMLILWVIASEYSYTYSPTYGYPDIMTGHTFSRLSFLILALVFIFMMTMLNLPFTAACGLSASADHRNSGVALARALGTRLVVLLAPTLIPLGIGYFFHPSFNPSNSLGLLALVGVQVLVTLVENGVFVGGQLITYGLAPYAYSEDGYLWSTLFALLLAPIIYALLTWLILRFARRRAVRQGALPSYAR